MMEEDTEGSSQSETRVPGCCVACHGYEDLRNQLEPDFILLNASKNGHVDCVKACLAEGIEIKPWRKAALFETVSKDFVDYTKLLLKAGADVNIRDRNGRTALFSAAMEN